jgi:hypothetical protein
MNCLDYRRSLLTGAGETDAMTAHRLQCVTCADTFAEHQAFEAELRLGLEIEPAPGFEARLLQARSARRRQFLAAASVAVVAAGLGAYAWLRRDDPLALACIQFVMKEEAKSIMMGAMPRAEASKALAVSLPLERIERVGRIQHVGPCPFNGATAYHVVLAVPQGKVTILVMPETALQAGQRAVLEGMHASVAPLRKGSVGVIGTDADVVASVMGALLA